MILARMQSLNIRRLHRLRRFRSDVVLCHGGKDTVCSRRFCEFLRSLRRYSGLEIIADTPARPFAVSQYRAGGIRTHDSPSELPLISTNVHQRA